MPDAADQGRLTACHRGRAINFLAHLWLTDRAGLPLAGAVLGDVVRGRLDHRHDLPADLLASIRYHRQVDVATDHHPISIAARARFPTGARRWAGIVLDLVHDHALALDWSAFSDEPLEAFARRAAATVADDGVWRLAAGRSAPDADRFAETLLSYCDPAGIDCALERIATRTKRAHLLIEHSASWRVHLPAVRRDGPVLLAHLIRSDALSSREECT